MHLGAFLIDWEKCGGSSFIELSTGVNLAFIAWDQFQRRLQYFEVQGRNLTAQAMTWLLEETHEEHVKAFFKKIQKPLESSFRVTWHFCYILGWLAVISGFVMLFFNWSCSYDWLILSPIALYLSICILFYFGFWLVCKITCKFANVVFGSWTAKVEKAAISKIKAAAEDGIQKEQRREESKPQEW